VQSEGRERILQEGRICPQEFQALSPGKVGQVPGAMSQVREFPLLDGMLKIIRNRNVYHRSLMLLTRCLMYRSRMRDADPFYGRTYRKERSYDNNATECGSHEGDHDHSPVR
jgi:hypothetical protein